MATWWIFVQILTSFYTAHLTAFFTLSAPKNPVGNLVELTQRPHPPAKWVSVRGIIFQDLLKVSDDAENIFHSKPHIATQ